MQIEEAESTYLNTENSVNGTVFKVRCRRSLSMSARRVAIGQSSAWELNQGQSQTVLLSAGI